MAIGCSNLGNFRRAWAFLAALAPLTVLYATAQYPGQLAKPANPAPALRAVSVLEWTGEEGHPKASRLVPLTVFDGESLQDGSVYLARPYPLSLAPEVEYELQRNGKPIGLYDLAHAGQEQGTWVGYGAWRGLPKPQPKTAAKPLPLNPSWNDEDDRPVLHRKHHADEEAPAKSGAGNAKPDAPAADPDRPTLHRKDQDSASAPDSDRPVLHKKTNETDSSASAPEAEPDPDRPTLRKKRASSEDGKKKKKSKDDVGYVESLPEATDPDRPKLKRGKPTEAGPAVLPSLLGMPENLHQAVAVSDVRPLAEHPWSFSWADPADAGKMKIALEQIARDALGLTPPPAPAPTSPLAARRGKRKKAAAPTEAPLPPEPAPLLGEDFRIFELAYGSGATLVLSAHSGGEGAQDKFVTLIAQPDLYGNLLVLHKSTTDAAHFDVTPRMRLVDAVDAEADNRGELLFELRGSTQRQFALYRVLRGEAQQIFITATTDLFTGRTETK